MRAQPDGGGWVDADTLRCTDVEDAQVLAEMEQKQQAKSRLTLVSDGGSVYAGVETKRR